MRKSHSGFVRGLKMSDLLWLTDEQMERLRTFFPKSHGKPRVNDRRVPSGIIFVNRNGLRWRDAPREYGPYKTLYSRWQRQGDLGIFMRMTDGLSAAKAEPRTIMIDATYLKAHRTASSGAKKGSKPSTWTDRRWQKYEAACDHGSEWTTAELS